MLHRCLIIRSLFVAAIMVGFAAPAQADNVAISWYTGGEARLKLQPIADESSASVVFSGRTTQKNLLVTVARKGGASRSNAIPLQKDGSFNVRYLIKDGVGSYTITFFGNERKDDLNYRGLASLVRVVEKELPADLRNVELNGKIVAFVDQAAGSKVGRGECWDLAQEALDTNLADWSRPVTFGRLLDPESDEIKAGDIIQFRALKITEHLPGNVTRQESLGNPDHTAVIYKVLGKKHYTLAHQNVAGKRRVVKTDIDLAQVVSGRYWIYRPEALMIRQ